MADITIPQILAQYEKQKKIIQYSEYICTNIDFMAAASDTTDIDIDTDTVLPTTDTTSATRDTKSMPSPATQAPSSTGGASTY